MKPSCGLTTKLAVSAIFFDHALVGFQAIPRLPIALRVADLPNALASATFIPLSPLVAC